MVSGVFAVVILLLWLKEQLPDRPDPQRALQAQRAAVVEAERQKVRDAAQKVKEAACRTNLQCWGDQQSAPATVRCQEPIEKIAKHQAEWTDSWTEPKFSHWKWLSVERGILTYSGNKIKLQNGFGAWTPYTYECDYDTQNETVLAVRAQPGRLP